MAQKVSVQLLDDLDGSEASSTVTLSLDGSSYELDLSTVNDAMLRNTLAPYIEAARVLGKGRGKPKPARKTPTSTAPKTASNGNGHGAVIMDNETIRQWARDNGMTVKDRGRISASLVDAFKRGIPIPAQP